MTRTPTQRVADIEAIDRCRRYVSSLASPDPDLVDKLCRRGLTVRRRGADPADCRVVMVELTPRGADAAREIAVAYSRQNEPVIAAFNSIARWSSRDASTPAHSRDQRGA